MLGKIIGFWIMRNISEYQQFEEHFEHFSLNFWFVCNWIGFFKRHLILKLLFYLPQPPNPGQISGSRPPNPGQIMGTRPPYPGQISRTWPPLKHMNQNWTPYHELKAELCPLNQSICGTFLSACFTRVCLPSSVYLIRVGGPSSLYMTKVLGPSLYMTMVVGPSSLYMTKVVGPSLYMTRVVGPSSLYMTNLVGPSSLYMTKVLGPSSAYLTRVGGLWEVKIKYLASASFLTGGLFLDFNLSPDKVWSKNPKT